MLRDGLSRAHSRTDSVGQAVRACCGVVFHRMVRICKACLYLLAETMTGCLFEALQSRASQLVCARDRARDRPERQAIDRVSRERRAAKQAHVGCGAKYKTIAHTQRRPKRRLTALDRGAGRYVPLVGRQQHLACQRREHSRCVGGTLGAITLARSLVRSIRVCLCCLCTIMCVCVCQQNAQQTHTRTSLAQFCCKKLHSIRTEQGENKCE